MPILNYTTRVPVNKTIGDIHKALARAKARQIMTEYNDEGEPIGITFQLIVNEIPIYFKLPIDVEGVAQAMKNDSSCQNSYCRPEQYPRVAWRILKDWIEAQLAIVEANQADVPQVFLPYAMSGHQTLYERFQGNGFKLIGHED